MIDDDNPIQPETLELLLEDDKDIVGATILSRNPNKNNEHDLCAFYSHEHKVDGKKLKLYDNIKDFKEEGFLHKVDAIGTGCILIKTKVLAKMMTKYKDGLFEFGDIKFNKPVKINGKDYDRRTMSEDCEFPLLPSTKILTNDFKWKQLKDFRVGDSVFGFDEFPKNHNKRYFQDAKVEKIIHKELPLWEIETTEGKITTTAEHPWLYKRNWRSNKNVKLNIP